MDRTKVRVFQLAAAPGHWLGYVGQARVVQIKPRDGECLMPQRDPDDPERLIEEGGWPYDLYLNNGRIVTMYSLQFIEAVAQH